MSCHNIENIAEECFVCTAVVLFRGVGCYTYSRLATAVFLQIFANCRISILFPACLQRAAFLLQTAYLSNMTMNDKLHSYGVTDDPLLATAVEAALRAGEKLKTGFGTTFGISAKEGYHNLVTEYDTAAEKIILDHITSVYPDHVFLAEESGATGRLETDTVQWVVDPLDGTVNFAHGVPIFAVSIGAVLNNELLCGVIYQPLLDELFTASRGGGAWLNGTRLHVAAPTTLQDSFLVTGFPYNVNENPRNTIGHFSRIVGMGVPVRRLGSAALDLAYVAAGRFDGFWEVKLNPWDVAAGQLLVEEAGGTVTHYDGSPYQLHGDTIIASSGGRLHEELSMLLCA
jgi:myo-inositol-1(or 4)-monophosphatase